MTASGHSCAKAKLCSEKHIGSFNSAYENVWKLAGRHTSKCTNVISLHEISKQVDNVLKKERAHAGFRSAIKKVGGK